MLPTTEKSLVHHLTVRFFQRMPEGEEARMLLSNRVASKIPPLDRRIVIESWPPGLRGFTWELVSPVRGWDKRHALAGAELADVTYVCRMLR